MEQLSCERCVVGHFSRDMEEEHVEHCRYACRFASDMEVADIACDSGYGSKMLADAGARSVKGVDVSTEAICRAKVAYVGQNLTFTVGDAEKLEGIKDNSVDLFVSFETIEHLHSVGHYLDEVARVLKPGGQYLVSTPDRQLASSMYPLRHKPNNPFHVLEYTESELRRTLERRFGVEWFSGQAYINRVLVFWSLQVFLKGTCYLLRSFGAYRLLRKFYHLGSGFTVEPQDAHKGKVARFWEVRCPKLAAA